MNGHKRGCACGPCVARRRYARLYARRQRRARLEARWRSGGPCPAGLGGGACGGRITVTIGTLGQTLMQCERCERKRRGICRDCSMPVAGRIGYATRCAYHRHIAKNRAVRSYVERNRRTVNAKARRYARKNRTRNGEYKRLWRKANRDKVRAQKRRYALRQPATMYAYHAQRRANHVTPTNPARRTPTGDRLCLTPTCITAVHGRTKKCASCRNVEALIAREKLATREYRAVPRKRQRVA